MRSIEIPQPDERHGAYRFFEILPGTLTWTILLLPIILGIFSPTAAAYFIIAYILIWFFRAIAIAFRSLQGWRRMNQHTTLPWPSLIEDLETLKVTAPNAPSWHARNIDRVREHMPNRILPSQVYHAVIIPFWKESREILEPTLQAVMSSEFDTKKIILILAYEQRGGETVAKTAKDLAKQYGRHFYHAESIMHPWPIAGEVIGKGGNATWAGRRLKKLLVEEKINPDQVLVTVLDADNRPHKKYFGALTYTFCSTEEPRYASYQPIPMFTNNIWDAPAPMRVIATGNSFWMVVQSMRQHMLRNFSAHAQPMSALIDTDFWSVRSIVEDGHQYWRTWFRYNGRHEVFPIFTPIYQDAVLNDTYLKTIKAQFVQVQRWAYGASDIAYVAYNGWFKPNHIPKLKLWPKFLRLLEGHVSWSTAPLILALSAQIPYLLNRQNFVANQLPRVVSRVQMVAMVGILITLFLSMKALPPKPERYKRRRTVWMVVQWVYLPLTTITFSSFAAINSQTRLMFGWYLTKFNLTEKSVKK